MKKIFTKYLLAVAFIIFATVSNAQVTVNVTGASNTTPALQASYGSLAAAITDLNLVNAMTGPVVLDLNVNEFETAPVGGYQLGSATLNAVLSSSNTITIQTAGGGANPLITAFTGTTTSTDGIFKLLGCDYVTIDGLDLQDDPANITTTTSMEWGYALVKRQAVAPFDGCQNIVIKNCNISLKVGATGMNTATVGIYSGNHIATSTTSLTLTAVGDANSNNKFFNNTIDAFTGFRMAGFNGASPYSLYDQGNEIGVDGANTITNFGGATSGTAYCVYGIYQNNLKVNNNNFNGGAEQISTSYGVFISTSNNSNFDVNNNNIDITSAATTSALYGIGFSTGSVAGTTNTINVNNNDIRVNRTLATTGVTYIVYSTTNYPLNFNINNNFIHDCSLSGTGTVYGIGQISSVVNFRANNNTISNITRTGTTGSSVFYGIYNTASTSSSEISNNTIENISGMGGSGVVAGIATGSTLIQSSVFGNRIYNISSASTSGIVYGISVTAGTSNLVYNNLIGQLYTPDATGTDAVRGISITSSLASSTSNVYYNSIHMDASSTGANFGSSGIYHTTSTTATTSALNLRNNIIFNNSAPAGTGLTVAFRRSSGLANTLANYAATSNNNLFYAGTPGASNLIYSDGTSSAQTINQYKNGVFTAGTIAARDASSVSENPGFQSTVGSNANFLKYNTLVAKQLESGAANIAGITTDVAGTIRAGNGGYSGTGAAPDMGAWELEGIGADLSGPAISYTALGNTLCLSDRTLSPVTITDASSVNTTGGTRPRLYFRKSTNANTYDDNTAGTDGWKYVEADGSGDSPFSFTSNYSLIFGGVVAGDIIEYFVVAEDLAGTPNVGVNAGTFTAPPTTVALSSAEFPLTGANSYTLLAGALSGTVNVGPGETYTTLTAAGGLFSAINAGGLGANLTANITGNIITEDGAVALNSISYGCAGPYTLTIKPTGTFSVSGTTTGALIRINAADNVIIDGSIGTTSNTVCPPSAASRDLTIANTNTGTSSAVIWMQSSGSDGATNNTVKNCIINGNSATTTLMGIGSGSSTISITSLGTGNNSNQFINNAVSAVQYGIYSQGASLANKNTGTIINQNNVSVTGRGGIWVGFENGINISGNRVSNMTATSDLIAITLGIGNAYSNSTNAGNEVTNAFVSNNIINKISNTGTNSAAGIAVASATSGTNNLVNNSISEVSANGTSSDICVGILLGGGTGSTTNLYFNSVAMNGTITGATTGNAQSLALAVTNATAPMLDIRNNVFSNTQLPNAGGTTKFYAVGLAYSSTPGNYTGLISDNNDLYTLTGANYFVGTTGGIAAGTTRTFTDWQTETGKDAGSINVDAMFNANDNLQPQTGSLLVSAGVTGTGITTDIVCGSRNNPPTIGAYETTSDVAAPAIIYTALTNTCSTADILFSANITDGSGVPTTGALQPRVYFTKNAGAYTSTQGVLASGTGLNGTWDFTISASAMGGVAAADVISYFVIAQDVVGNIGSNPAAGLVASDVNTVTTAPSSPNTYNIQIILGGTYTVGTAGTYPTITAAVNAYNNSCLTGAVIFELQDATYAGETLPITINANIYASSTYSLTIRPAAAVNPVISGSSATSIFKLDGADFVTIDGSNNGTTSRDMTIRNTSVSTSTAVIWLSSLGAGAGATNNVIKNNIIEAGALSASTIYGIHLSGATISSSSLGADNNINSIQNNHIRKAGTGIYARGVAATGELTGLMISDNIIGDDNSANYIREYGMYLSSLSTPTIEANEVYNFRGDYSKYGIWFGTNISNARITRNRIHGFSQIGTTSTYYSSGIYFSSATSCTNNQIDNNAIYDLDSYGSTSTVVYNSGIRVTGGDGYKIYFNTVSLTAPYGSTTTSVISSCLSVTTASTNMDIRNNIFLNTRTGSGTTPKAYGIYTVSGTTYQTINHNDYYNGVDPRAIAYIGGAEVLDLTALQAATTQDANSISDDPLLNSATTMQPLIGSPAILAGDNTTGITIDIIEFVRGNPPTIGAYETASDAAAPEIVYTALTNTCSTADILLSANITDLTGVPTSGILQPRIYFRKNANAYVSAQGTLSSGTANNGNWDFTISGSAMGGVAAGDVISYYVIAQDDPGNVGSNPAAGLVASDVNTVTTAPSLPNTYNIQNSLGGTYTVGTAGTYPTITAAVNAYNNSCLTSAVVFELLDASYTGETLPISIDANPFASGTNLLTIRPAAGVTTSISGSSTSSVFKLNGADFVTIDGSNNGTTTRDMTIINTSVSTNTAVIWLSSLGAGAGATNNSIKNTIIEAGAVAASNFGIQLGGLTITTTTTGADNNINTIENNQIRKVGQGIYARGVASTGELTGLIVKNNIIGDANSANYIRDYGMNFASLSAPMIEANEVFNLRGDYSKYGIFFVGNISNARVTRNKIHGFSQIGTTSSYYAIGIYFSSTTGCINNQIDNNAIYDMHQYGSTSNFYYAGIRIVGGTDYKIYFNTISMTGAFGSATAGVFSHCLFVSTASANMDIRNNILLNTRTGNAPKAYTIYTVSGTTFSNINNNDYYSTGAAIGYITTEVADLTALQAATTMDANSISADPLLNSSTSMQPLPGSPAILAGDNSTGITIDIIEFVRGNPPTMGAYEVAINLPIAIEYFRGSKQSAGNFLDWKVSCTGSPYATLVLERSADGRNFKVVNSQEATALRCLSPFNYTDANALAGINFYRLKMIDADGKISYSHIVALLNTEKGYEIVSMMPNPAREKAILTISSAVKTSMDLVITDINGKQLSKQRTNLIAGSNQLPLNLSNLAAGSYQVTAITAEGVIKSLRFIKQ